MERESTTEPESQGTADHGSKRRSWRFWLLVVVLTVVLLPIILVAIALVVLRSEAGTAWVLDQVPGLQTEGDRGSLFGYWEAESVRWQGYGVGLRLDAVVVDWSPGCLFSKELCLDTLHADAIDLKLQPSSEPEEPREDIDLPLVNLPLGVRIGDVRLGPFTMNDGKVWDRLELQAGGSGTDWVIDRVNYRLDEIAVDAAGRMETRGDWPLDLNVDVSLPPPGGDNWQLALNLTGSARDLRVSGRSSGYLAAAIEGRLAPLDKRLPARLNLQSPSFLVLDTLPPTLILEDWQLSVNGSLEEGFVTRSTTTLPGTRGGIETSLRGLLTTTGVSDLVLEMAGPGEGSEQGTLQVQGDVSWEETLSATANIGLESFPWYSLIPDFEEPPVALRRLEGEVSYSDNRYNARLNAAVSGPLGDADLETALEGDLETVSLTNLTVRTGAGSLTGDADIDFAGQLAWNAGLTLDEFNPGYWVPILEANLSGDLNSQGKLADDGLPDMVADWEISGTWQDKPATTSGELKAVAGVWDVAGLNLEVGKNRIHGRGRWGSEIAGNLDIQVPEPDILVPGLAGELRASLTVSGSPEDPQGEVSVTANDLVWQDKVAISNAEVKASLASGLVLDASARADAIRAGGQSLERVELDLSGTQQEHRLTVRAVHEEADLNLALAGGAGEAWDSWRGFLDSGELDLPGQSQTWTLEQPAQLEYDNQGALALGAHCWRWQDSSICGEDQTLMPNPQVAYRVSNFPSQSLASLLPETLRWRSRINANINLAMTDQGPDGSIALDAGAGEFEVLVQEDWETLRHDMFTVDVDMKPQVADVAVRLSGPELGDFAVNLSVDPTAGNRTVSGDFSLEGLDIALAGVVAGLDEVEGEINGQGQLSGPLMKPAVNGEIALSGGRFVDPSLPLPLEDVVLALTLKGYSADLSGRWKSNDRSEGRLSGELSWETSPAVEVTITGDRLPVTYDPYARVEVAPDITLAYRDGDLSVTGRVDVPRGEIEVQALPEQAVSVSEDEVIVGVEQDEPAVRSLNMDVTVVVGEDQVTFAAFGVTGDLEGTLRIGNDMDTRGSLQLRNGQYEAYGQELELRRARIVFVGPLTEPYLDIEAVRHVDTVVAGIRLSGPVSEPKTEVFSEPSMPQSDALSYVILGRPPQGRGDEGQMSRAALSLGLTQASKLTQGIGDELGIRNLMLEAEGTGDEASVVASGYITDELSLRYGVGIFEPITTVALRYDLGRYFYLEAASGLAASLDIFYTRDF
ncbi:translocation/assembly module TamB domain-containing protein [Marinobacter sp. HN1S83]|uniref:translocation/assembly module TamB domain-containing protein n=1 Tax=Marinobacter sp. HN1S83 TaxID=3382301 RepID=UPI00387B38BD